MNDIKDKAGPKQNEELDKPLCTCMTDPFTSLPPDLRLRSKEVLGGLRKVNCPACGSSYWTNREIDLCIECEKKGLHLPGV